MTGHRENYAVMEPRVFDSFLIALQFLTAWNFNLSVNGEGRVYAYISPQNPLTVNFDIIA